MKKFIFSLPFFTFFCLWITSCEQPDSGKEWGNALIYMPQANYNPYVVPNGGDDDHLNKNYKVNTEDGTIDIYLGVYRSGLQELEAYTVSVAASDAGITNTTMLPSAQYSLPASVACKAGSRDATFYLSVKTSFLLANPDTHYSLAVTISSPSAYSLNTGLATTKIHIKTRQLLENEELIP